MCVAEDTCDWQQSQEDDFDWIIFTGQPSSNQTGPEADHTTGTEYGHYLLIDADGLGREECTQIPCNKIIYAFSCNDRGHSFYRQDTLRDLLPYSVIGSAMLLLLVPHERKGFRDDYSEQGQD